MEFNAVYFSAFEIHTACPEQRNVVGPFLLSLKKFLIVYDLKSFGERSSF